ncbi:MAG TPA: flagellin [Tepidisphaeraceae bacterium]|jgi:flagellin|nr:flagellin [Tepidisphaeraceae bacterium]
MSRINTNVSSLISQRVLGKNNSTLNTSLQRLSTGLKINTGADNPAGLIASENLRAEKVGITTAIDNAQRASNIIGTAEGGLNEVSSLLVELQGLLNQSANSGGLSTEELAANQLQVDSVLSTINRIAQSTAFQGTKLLNGNYDYTTSSVGTSAVQNLQVNSTRIPDGANVSVVVQVVTSAQTGTITYSGGSVSGDTVTLEISGNNGTEQLSFASGTTVSSIATAINGVKTATGVSAAIVGGSLQVNSTTFGSSQFVGLKALTGTFALTSTKDYGVDANVTVNGSTAQTDGLRVQYRSSNVDIEFDLAKTVNINNQTKTFGIIGGGATFALGSKVTETDKASIGIASVSTGSLGDTTLGFLSSIGSGGTNSLTSDNLTTAQKILDRSIKQVSGIRGRLGAFQKFTIGSTINSLGVAFENASAAESAIRDTDFAAETAEMTRAQILSQAASTVLSQANSAPQAALRLLQG